MADKQGINKMLLRNWHGSCKAISKYHPRVFDTQQFLKKNGGTHDGLLLWCWDLLKDCYGSIKILISLFLQSTSATIE